jgi:hypothetical protein
MTLHATPSARRAAENQSLFRVVNDRIEELHEIFQGDGPPSEFVCECADESCCAHMVLTTQEYERLRAAPKRFAVLPGSMHVFPEYERIVEMHERYWVVEKAGPAADVAARLARR